MIGGAGPGLSPTGRSHRVPDGMPENLQPTAPRGGILKDLAAVGALLLITLAVFADVLFTVSPPVLSSAGADL